MNVFRVAGLMRKSPVKSSDEAVVSMEKQRDAILDRLNRDFGSGAFEVEWFFDVASGDSELVDRVELSRFFQFHEEFDFAYAFNVDRFSRTWRSIGWFHEYFVGDGKPKLRFVQEPLELYTDVGGVDPTSYTMFALLCVMAEAELMKIRDRSRRGIDRVLSDPKLRREKYKGGVKGRSWTRKKGVG
jgi:DNA invertase Pin-like site-specific DNA recombinase